MSLILRLRGMHLGANAISTFSIWMALSFHLPFEYGRSEPPISQFLLDSSLQAKRLPPQRAQQRRSLGDPGLGGAPGGSPHNSDRRPLWARRCPADTPLLRSLTTNSLRATFGSSTIKRWSH